MKNQFLEITDPIHDFIRLNSTEQKIILNPAQDFNSKKHPSIH